jgi:hypothetical protein
VTSFPGLVENEGSRLPNDAHEMEGTALRCETINERLVGIAPQRSTLKSSSC